MSIFHLAYHVDDLDAARSFYAEKLGCRAGRSTDSWIDFDFFGHQITAHLSPAEAPCATNPVDGDDVNIRLLSQQRDADAVGPGADIQHRITRLDIDG